MRVWIGYIAACALTATAAAEIKTEAVDYRDGELALQGYLAYDDTQTGKRPAVLIVHEWWGLNDFAKEQARRLAKLGYVAFAVDMYGKGKVTEDPQQAGQWARALYGDPKSWRKRAKAGLDVLAQHERVDADRIAAIGYCFGGATVQQMAWAGLKLRGVVSFHGSLIPPTTAEAQQTRARVLILHGAADTLISKDDFDKYLAALQKTDIDWQMEIFSDAKHSFTNPKADALGMDGVGYDKQAAARSWKAMRVFFGELFDEAVTVKP